MSIQKLQSLGVKLLSALPDPDSLNGMGSRRLAALKRAGIFDVADLLLTLPRDYEDRRSPRGLASLYEGEGSTRVFNRVQVLRVEYFYARRRRTPRIWIEDDGGRAVLLCFGRPFLAEKLRPGSSWLLAGTFALRKGELQSSSFDVVPDDDGNANGDGDGDGAGRHFFCIQALYSHIPGIYQGVLQDFYAQSLDRVLPLLGEDPTLERELRGTADMSSRLAQLKLPAIDRALAQIHRPQDMSDIEPARRRLAYGELRWLYLNQRRPPRPSQPTTAPAQPPGPSPLQQALLDSLPFSLTPDQAACLVEINQDLARSDSSATAATRSDSSADNAGMYRLLQGDVGSGKTLVALLAALRIVEEGRQAAFMVPTEILAHQHLEKIRAMLEALDMPAPYLFIAAMTRTERKGALDAMRDGRAGIWLGTHSLLSEGVEFARLGLVIIDEQHRFGVNQREQLRSKGLADRVLMLSATPIPRTLTLTLFGSMDISTIRSMPPGRLPVKTHLALMGREEKVYSEVERELALGRQAYFVYPRVKDDEAGAGAGAGADEGLKSAEQMQKWLKKRFPKHSIGLVHGQQNMAARQAEMQAFVQGAHHILVATTVIEVGVDLPNVSVMVIEHAERFGLSALHQLRGRVGRGLQQSYCYLIYDPALTDDARARLRVMKEHIDGFELAEADLKIRGPGNIVGTEQSGYLNLDFASLYRDTQLIEAIVNPR